MMDKRVVIIDPFKEKGGQEKFCGMLATYLAVDAFDVTLICDAVNKENCHILASEFKGQTIHYNLGSVFAALRALVSLDELNPDIIISNSERISFAIGILKRLGLIRTKVIHIFHLSYQDSCNYIHTGIKKSAYQLFYQIAKNSDFAISVATHINSSLITDVGWKKENTKIIRNGDKRSILSSSQSKDLTKPDLDQPIQIGFIGRFCKQKRPDLILSALELLPTELRKKVVLNVAGEAAAELYKSGEYSANSGVNVKFWGYVSDMKSFYSGMDFIVSSSDYEGMPLVALECVSKNIPILLSRNNAHLEMLEQTYPYFFVLGSAESLANKIEDKINMREFEGYARFIKHDIKNWDDVFQEYVATIEGYYEKK